MDEQWDDKKNNAPYIEPDWFEQTMFAASIFIVPVILVGVAYEIIKHFILP